MSGRYKRICISVPPHIMAELEQRPGPISITVCQLVEYAMAAGFMQALNELEPAGSPKEFLRTAAFNKKQAEEAAVDAALDEEEAEEEVSDEDNEPAYKRKRLEYAKTPAELQPEEEAQEPEKPKSKRAKSSKAKKKDQLELFGS